MLESESRLFISAEADLCTGCGRCVEHAPDLFGHADDGLVRVKIGETLLNNMEEVPVPKDREHAAVLAAEDCQGEIIYIDSHVVRVFED